MDLKVFHEDEWREYPAKTYAEYTHEWLGEPHDSESVRLDGDGNEAARNLAINPAARRNILWASNRTATWPVIWDDIDDHPLGLTRARKSINIDPSYSPDILSLYNVGVDRLPEPSIIAMGIWVKASVPAYVRNDGVVGDAALAPGEWKYVRRVFSGALTGIAIRAADTDDLPHAEAWATGVTVGVADTEEAALAQVEHYFDGDTPPSRAWVNFTPRNASGINRIWPRSATPPPADTHYAWLGEPHESVSVRLDSNGNEMARNLWSNPSFEKDLTGFSGGNTIRERSDEWSASGDYSMKMWSSYALREGSGYVDIVGMSSDEEAHPLVERGKTYTLLATVYKDREHGGVRGLLNAVGSGSYGNVRANSPDEVGEHQLRLTFTVPDLGSWFYLRMQHFGLDTDPPIWWDNVALIEGEYDGPYFDGDSQSDRAHDLWYNTDGVPHEWVNGQGWVAQP